jgi:16S rRNA (cytidine1402-2'-O)-methyltransferase
MNDINSLSESPDMAKKDHEDRIDREDHVADDELALALNAEAAGKLPCALYVVATPLGNRNDITQRALSVLREADVVACEDTRHARPLLEHYGVKAPLTALHQHNEQAAADKLIAMLAKGYAVALISDAGTPAVSDPGARVVARVQDAGYRVIPLPGPSAVVTALSASGLMADRFLFVGFLSSRSAARCSEMAAVADVAAALVFYEAPHRIVEMVDDLLKVYGPQREVVIARELTKLFEQIVRLPLADAPAWLAADNNHQRGEFVVIVSPPPAREAGLDAATERVLSLLLAELPTKQAAKLAAQITGAAKNDLYQRALDLKQAE